MNITSPPMPLPGPCPNCGRCPGCGHTPAPSYPLYPLPVPLGPYVPPVWPWYPPMPVTITGFTTSGGPPRNLVVPSGAPK